MVLKHDKTYATVQNLFRMFRTLRSEMPMQQADVLVTIARNPGITMGELSDETGLAQSSCSRNVAALSEWHRLGKEGLGFVRTLPDPRETRRLTIHLTPKGAAFVTELLGSIDPSFRYTGPVDGQLVQQWHEEAKRLQEADEKSRLRGMTHKADT